MAGRSTPGGDSEWVALSRTKDPGSGVPYNTVALEAETSDLVTAITENTYALAELTRLFRSYLVAQSFVMGTNLLELDPG